MNFAHLTCKPPAIGDTPFSPAQAEQMMSEIGSWSLSDAEVTRMFKFKDFCAAMAFVNKVAEIAEGQGHHPDFFISYKTVRLTLTTHKIGGLSLNDFIMAAKIDQLLASQTVR